MEKKKPTKAQIERRMNNALVLVPKDKDYQGIFFADKGLRLEITSDFAIISTGHHRHVFDNVTLSGVSRPYIFTKRFIEIALETDCVYKDENGDKFYSYQKLMNELKQDKDSDKYAVVFFCDMWFYNLFAPLYTIDNNNASSFRVFLEYVCNIAHHAIILDERNEDLTSKKFLSQFIDKVDELTKNIDDSVLIAKKTDVEIMQENIDALQAQAVDEAMRQDNIKITNENGK